MKTVANFDHIGEENAFAVLARATALAAQGKDIIHLGLGQPDFLTPDHILAAAAQALPAGHPGSPPAPGRRPPGDPAVAACPVAWPSSPPARRWEFSTVNALRR